MAAGSWFDLRQSRDRHRKTSSRRRHYARHEEAIGSPETGMRQQFEFMAESAVVLKRIFGFATSGNLVWL